MSLGANEQFIYGFKGETDFEDEFVVYIDPRAGTIHAGCKCSDETKSFSLTELEAETLVEALQLAIVALPQ